MSNYKKDVITLYYIKGFRYFSILFITLPLISYIVQNKLLFILFVFSLALLLILSILHLLVLIIKELEKVFDEIGEIRIKLKE